MLQNFYNWTHYRGQHERHQQSDISNQQSLTRFERAIIWIAQKCPLFEPLLQKFCAPLRSRDVELDTFNYGEHTHQTPPQMQCGVPKTDEVDAIDPFQGPFQWQCDVLTEELQKVLDLLDEPQTADTDKPQKPTKLDWDWTDTVLVACSQFTDAQLDTAANRTDTSENFKQITKDIKALRSFLLGLDESELTSLVSSACNPHDFGYMLQGYKVLVSEKCIQFFINGRGQTALEILVEQALIN